MSLSQLDNLAPHPVLLAPMVGLSHCAVRMAISEYLPLNHRSLWATEMLSSRRLPHQQRGETPEILFDDVENGLSPQLLGNEENLIRESVKRLEDWGAKAIDINMGCPVQQALKHNYGVALMGDADYAARITEMTVRATRLPVSVKLRAGLQKDSEFLVNFAKGIERAGASWLTLHPRTAEQKRRGSADWSQIRLLKSELMIPVIGNGDIQTVADIRRMMNETLCDRVMVGRALLAKPWMLTQIVDATAGPKNSEEAGAAYGRFVSRVLELSKRFYSEDVALRKLRFFVYHGCVWLEFGHFLYAQLKGAPDFSRAQSAIDSFFSQPQRLLELTERRR